MFIRSIFSRLVLFACTGLALILPPTASAQMVQYTTETTFKIDAFGVLGGMLGRKPVTSMTYVTRDRMATVTGDAGSIVSLPDRILTSVDFKRRTYREMTFEQMVAMAENMAADVQQEANDAAPAEGDSVRVTYEFDVSVDDLGETETISGVSTERKLITIELRYTAEGTDETGQTETASGKFFAVTDAWVGEGAEGHAIVQDFTRAYAAEFAMAIDPSSSPVASLGQILQQDGRIGPAFERMAEEMKKLNGTPLRSTTYIVTVPLEMELDVDLLLGRKKAEKKRGAALGGIARSALRSRGIPVAGETQTEAPPAEQQTLLTMNEVYTSIEEVAIDPARFQVPAGFAQEIMKQ